jgi:hypothetical protein
MAVPTVPSIGALAVGTTAITPDLPADLLVDDVLVLIARCAVSVPDIALSLTNQNGGTWTQVGFSHANNNVRLTIWWSRYNGSQGAPTTNATNNHQMARILAVRGAIPTGNPINTDAGEAPTFAETDSALTSITTTVADCLVLSVLAGSAPDADGTAVFSGWTNANLASLTEIVDDSTATGSGGSFGVAKGGKAAAGSTGTTAVTHASFAVAYKQLAIIPAAAPTVPTPGVTVSRNAAGFVTIDGSPIFVRGIYDSGLEGAGGSQDMAGHVVVRNLARFTDKLNFYINLYTGTFDNGLRLADALDPLHMYTLAIGNASYDWTAGASGTVQANSDANGPFDVVDNSNNFRFNFAGKARAAAVYLFDETREDALTDLATWQTTYTTAMPNLATFGVSWHTFIDPIIAYAESTVGTWLGADPYTIGAAVETAPGGTTNTYGYSNYDVGHTAAAVRYHALANDKCPMMVLQAFKFGTNSRFITNAELWSHMVAAVAEGCVGVWWWALGVQQGALHTSAWTTSERERVLAQIETMSGLLATLEPVLLNPSNPSLLTANSTVTGNAIQWRKDLLALLTVSGGPTWFEGVRSTFVTELAALNEVPANTAESLHILDQSSDVRTRCWEYGGLGYVFAYNLHPNERANVTFTWHASLTRVEVVGESRDITVTDGATWMDTFGGASSLRQGASNQGHIYRLYLGGTPTPPTAPVITAVSVNSASSVTIGMTAGSGATSHALYRGTTPNFPISALTEIAAYGPTVPTLYIDTGLLPSTTYYYRLVATNAAGTTASGEVSLATGGAGLLVASFGATVPATYVDTGLEPETQYFYRLVATTPSGFMNSGEITMQTLAAPFPVGGGVVFIYYVLGETQFRSTTDIAEALGSDRAVMAVYVGGTGLIVNWGKALTHGSDILAGTIGASQLIADQAVITGAAQIANAVVGNAHITDLSVSKMTAGSLAAQILVGTGKIATADTGARVELRQDALDVFDGAGQSVFRAQAGAPFVRIGRQGGSVPPLEVSSSGDVQQLVADHIQDLNIIRMVSFTSLNLQRTNPDNTAPAEVVLATYASAVTTLRNTDTIGLWWKIFLRAECTGGSNINEHTATVRFRYGTLVTSPILQQFSVVLPALDPAEGDTDIFFFNLAPGAARTHHFCLTGLIGGASGYTMRLTVVNSRLMLLSRSA